jgi:ribulose 1,5-bisphosphate synthetase/thiazole synthase
MTQRQPIKSIRLPSVQVPVIAQADVVVVGGGTAGFVAAIAAARTGAETVLIEQGGYLGGALTGTYVSNPGYFADSEHDQVIRGIAWEVVERLEQNGLALIDREKYKVQVFPEAVKSVALDMVTEAGVKLFLYAMLSDVIMEDDRISGIVMQSKSGRQVIEGKVFIDATGDADLAVLAGAPTEKAEAGELWQTSVDLVVANVDAARVIQWADEHPGEAISPELDYTHQPQAIQPMFTLLIPNPDTQMTETGIVHRGPMPTVKLMINRSISRVQGSVEIDPTDVSQITYAEIEGRKRALAHLDFLKKTVPGFEQAIVVGEAFLGVRESRRIVGDYVLTIQDVQSNARFSDVVLLNARALDRHLSGERFELVFVSGNHDIPYRSLIPKNVRNLLVAGRCISCDHESHASLRGAATCMGMGHAAGTAAALAAQSTGAVRDVDVKQLQSRLIAQGMVLSTEV